MNGNGMGMNPLELSLSALEGSISPEAQGVIGVPPAGTAADPFFDVPTTPNPLPRMREPTRTEVRRMEAAADRAVAARLSPALKRFGEIAKLVPGAERVRVRKRLPTGQIGPIGEWSLRDIQTSGDLEAFLMQYVRPRWKGGDYHLAVIDGSGREHDAGMIPMPDPPTDSLGLGAPASSEGHLDLVRDMMNRMERTMQPQAPVDPLEQIRRAKAMISELNGGQQNANDATLAMMLAMQQQRPAGPDPMMVQLLERLATKVEKLEQGNAALAAMPPPLPPAPAAPSIDIPAITNLLATVAVPLIVKMMERNDDRDRITPRDMIEILERRRTGDEDRLTARDAIALVRDLQSSVPQQSISDKMSELAALRELAQGLAGPSASSGPAQTTFWDALAAFASNKHFGDAMGKVLGGEVERRRGPQVATLPQPRELSPTSQPALPPRSQPWTPTAVAAAGTPAASTTQPTAAAARPAAPPRVVLPDSFAEYAKRMNEATDNEAFVLATIEGLNDLRPSEQWSTFVRAMLEGVIRNDREGVLRGLRNWTALLAQNGVLQPEVIDRSQAAFTEHWDAVHATITSMFGAPQQIGSQQSPAQSPVTAPGTVGPTSSPSDDEDDEGPPPVA